MPDSKSPAYGKPDDIIENRQKLAELVAIEFPDLSESENNDIMQVLGDSRWLPYGRNEIKYGINIFDFTPVLRRKYIELIGLYMSNNDEKFHPKVDEFVTLLLEELEKKNIKVNFGLRGPLIWTRTRVRSSAKLLTYPPRIISRFWSKGSFRRTGDTTNLSEMWPTGLEREHDYPTHYGIEES